MVIVGDLDHHQALPLRSTNFPYLFSLWPLGAKLCDGDGDVDHTLTLVGHPPQPESIQNTYCTLTPLIPTETVQASHSVIIHI